MIRDVLVSFDIAVCLSYRLSIWQQPENIWYKTVRVWQRERRAEQGSSLLIAFIAKSCYFKFGLYQVVRKLINTNRRSRFLFLLYKHVFRCYCWLEFGISRCRNGGKEYRTSLKSCKTAIKICTVIVLWTTGPSFIRRIIVGASNPVLTWCPNGKGVMQDYVSCQKSPKASFNENLFWFCHLHSFCLFSSLLFWEFFDEKKS